MFILYSTPLSRPLPPLPPDVDECVSSAGSICGSQRCENTIGSYRCLTSCEPGYQVTRSGNCVGECFTQMHKHSWIVWLTHDVSLGQILTSVLMKRCVENMPSARTWQELTGVCVTVVSLPQLMARPVTVRLSPGTHRWNFHARVIVKSKIFTDDDLLKVKC